MNEQSSIMPELTLNPTPISQEPPQNITESPQAGADIAQQNPLSESEMQMVEAFSKQIDITNSVQIMNYGSGTQQKMAEFADKTLEGARTKDTGEVGEMLTSLVAELKGFNVKEERKGVLGLFKKGADKIENLKIKYDSAEANVAKISHALEQHQVQLIKDISVLDQMYDVNLTYFKELTMYIMAGRKKLEEAKNTELAALREKAALTGAAEDAQAVNDFQAQIDRFDKKLTDLDLTRTISMQTAPQIRLIQNNDTMLAEKIQSTIVNTIPLWKNQMLLALGMTNAQKALRAQQAVSDMTNELLKKNAATLKQTTVDTAREAQRAIVDIETLKQTNAALIETLDEVVTIQSQAREKRAQAEKELRRMENEIKVKLLEIK